MIQLIAENLYFALGSGALLDGVSLQLQEKERVGLIGRNGCGKSSLLKILSGTIKADDGVLSIQNGLTVSYVAQEPDFDLEKSVFDTLSDSLGQTQIILKAYYQQSHILAKEPNNSEALACLHELQNELDSLNGWQVDSLIQRTIQELGLPEDSLLSTLSGGQKKRVALARAWVQKPDILLLDEPTNHLDIDSISWLENILKQFSGSLIVISHDRQFLNHITTRIIELDRGILRQYAGNFNYYCEKKAEELAVEAEHNRLFDKFHAQEEAWIRKGIEARRTRNQGRVKRLENLRRERAKRRESQGQIKLQTQVTEQSGKLIALLENVSFSYDNQMIIKGFSTIIQRGDKVGLVGANGVGKTTLLKLILGDLLPDSGKLQLGTKQHIAYFDQFRSTLNEDDTVFYTLGQGNDFIEINGKKRHIISYLEDFLFSPERSQSPVKSLSGGERNRLLLAKLFIQKANILVLDEPTNDLDIDSQEVLESFLRDYTGTVFLVSHDRELLDNVVTQCIVFEGEGYLKEYIGGYSDYIDAKKREISQVTTLTSQVIEKKELRKSSRTTSKLSYKEQRELEMLPDEITALEQEQADLLTKLSDPNAYNQNNYQKTIEWQKRSDEIEVLLLEKMERWAILEDKQEQLKSI